MQGFIVKNKREMLNALKVLLYDCVQIRSLKTEMSSSEVFEWYNMENIVGCVPMRC